MHDEELLAIASKLESASDSETAQSQLSLETPWLRLTGNRDALLQLAAVFLHAAASRIPGEEACRESAFLNHQQINESETDCILGSVQRVDSLTQISDTL